MTRSASRRRSASAALRAGLAALALSIAATIPSPMTTTQPTLAAEAPTPIATPRAAGPDRFTTAIQVTKRLFPAGPAPVIFLASGETFPDALAAGPAAAIAGGAVLLTRRDLLPAVVEAELVRLAPAKVVVAGGPSAVSESVMARVRAALGGGVTVERQAGVDRYETAAAITAATFPTGPTSTVFVAFGGGFPDALAAGAAAAGMGAPVLLSRHDALPPATAAELTRLAPERIVVVGGPSVVSTAVEQALASFAPTVERLAGPDRFATAAAVAARYFPAAETVVTATGLDYPDALAAVPLAASLDAPVLLVRPTSVPSPTRDRVVATRPSTVLAIGGPSVVAGATLDELAAWAFGRLTSLPSGPGYPTYDARYHDEREMIVAIRAAEARNPQLVQVFSVGKSHQGRDIWAAKVSDNVAVDEPEPEVLVDALHHAREHLTVEQAIYLLGVLSRDYATDAKVRSLVDSRETFIIFALNPDGWAYDLTGSPYRGWRKNRQPNSGTSYVGTDPNRNYDYRWACCGGSSGNPAAWNYRGPKPFSAPETRALAAFVNSRVVDGRQQIRTHVTLHTNGELILYPYGYTKTDVPSDMTLDDHATFVAMARAMARLNGYKAEQSSDLYVTDGDQIDWMYGRHRIFSFTFELYPPETVAKPNDHEPPDEVIASQNARNRSALLYLIEMAGCPYAAIGKAGAYC
jgi:carboxypeptidase T